MDNSTLLIIDSFYPQVCKVSGCGDLCIEEAVPDSTCSTPYPWQRCYKPRYCNMRSNGVCAFNNGFEILKCIESFTQGMRIN